MFFIDDTYESQTRFDLAKFLEYNEECHDILTSYFCTKIPVLSHFGERTISTDEYFPDLLSYLIYTHSQYWWILMIYNNLLEGEDLIAGLKVLYPSIDAYEELYFRLKGMERATVIQPSSAETEVERQIIISISPDVGYRRIFNEIPQGTIDGVNRYFTLILEPVPYSELVFINGVRQVPGTDFDYGLSGNAIMFTEAPKVGDVIRVDYDISD